MAAATGRLRRASRVLIATDSCGDVAFTIEAGVSLATAIGARLESMFVEDANLFRLAGLPFAVETSALTGTKRALASPELERALRVEAARLQSLIAGSAARARLDWSFNVFRGELLVAADAQQADLTVVALGRRTLSAPPSRAKAPGPISVLFDASVAAWRALDAASRLARALGSEVRLLVAAATPAEARRLAEPALAQLRREAVATETVPVGSDLDALSAALRARAGALLVLAAPEVAALPLDLRQLIVELSCPLMIVR